MKQLYGDTGQAPEPTLYGGLRNIRTNTLRWVEEKHAMTIIRANILHNSPSDVVKVDDAGKESC